MRCQQTCKARHGKPKHRCPRKAIARAPDDGRQYCAQHVFMNHTWNLNYLRKR